MHNLKISNEADEVIQSIHFNFWYDKFEELFPLATDKQIINLAAAQSHLFCSILNKDNTAELSTEIYIEEFKNTCLFFKLSPADVARTYHEEGKSFDEIYTLIRRYLNYEN